MKIQNVSRAAIMAGEHIPAKFLISICDPDQEYAQHGKEFDHILRLKFWDTNDMVDGCFQEDHAKSIIDFLEKAIEMDSDVVVHCNAGICRSGAVSQIGGILGFQEVRGTQSPNVLVKNLCNRILWNKFS